MANSDDRVIPALPRDHFHLVEALCGDSFNASISEVEGGAQAILVGDFTVTVPRAGTYIAVNHRKSLTETFDSYEALLSFLRSNVDRGAA